MTSSVFGGIAARNFGYSKVALHRRIALGDDGCLVTVYVRRTPEAELAVGREYFPDQDQASPNIAEQLRLMENVRRLRRELVETSARWEEVVRGAADAVCIIDVAGLVAFANARWRELLGVEGDELVGGTFERIVHPDDQAAFGQVRARVLQGERIVGYGMRLLHRDETWRDGIVSLGPLRDDDGRIVSALGIVRDVTDEHEAARLKDRLLSTTSHELRTPVATIKGLTQLLLRTIEQRGRVDPEQLVKRLQVIEREAERLALLGTDLVDVTALQTGRLTLSTKQEDLREIVRVCTEAQRAELRTPPAHRLVIDLPPEPVLVEVQAARVEQVVANVLENAVKYSPAGGDVTIRAGRDAASAWVTVTDAGIGIPATDISSVFTPFFRASNASVQNFGGLGLGLYLAKLIAQAHGGDLTVASAEGQGSSFTLTLPSAASSEGS